jgi:hypothetical protein
MEKVMSDYFLSYLKREHERLEREIEKEARRPFHDQVQIARLKKLKLAVKDQMHAFGGDEKSLVA